MIVIAVVLNYVYAYFWYLTAAVAAIAAIFGLNRSDKRWPYVLAIAIVTFASIAVSTRIVLSTAKTAQGEAESALVSDFQSYCANTGNRLHEKPRAPLVFHVFDGNADEPHIYAYMKDERIAAGADLRDVDIRMWQRGQPAPREGYWVYRRHRIGVGTVSVGSVLIRDSGTGELVAERSFAYHIDPNMQKSVCDDPEKHGLRKGGYHPLQYAFAEEVMTLIGAFSGVSMVSSAPKYDIDFGLEYKERETCAPSLRVSPAVADRRLMISWFRDGNDLVFAELKMPKTKGAQSRYEDFLRCKGYFDEDRKRAASLLYPHGYIEPQERVMALAQKRPAK